MKIAFLDCETTGTSANSSQLIAIGLIIDNQEKIFFADTHTKEKDILEKFKEEIQDIDAIISWYGKFFDIPFIIARAVLNNVDLSILMTKKHIDLYEFTQKNLKLSRYSLDMVSNFFGLSKDTYKRGLEIPNLYIKALEGDGEAKEKIISHLHDDLEILRKIYERLKVYIEKTFRQI